MSSDTWRATRNVELHQPYFSFSLPLHRVSFPPFLPSSHYPVENLLMYQSRHKLDWPAGKYLGNFYDQFASGYTVIWTYRRLMLKNSMFKSGKKWHILDAVWKNTTVNSFKRTKVEWYVFKNNRISPLIVRPFPKKPSDATGSPASW